MRVVIQFQTTCKLSVTMLLTLNIHGYPLHYHVYEDDLKHLFRFAIPNIN